MILLPILFTAIIWYLEIPPLIEKKLYKELIAYMIIYSIGFYLLAGHIMDWNIPKPGVIFLNLTEEFFPAFFEFMTPEGG